jgi:hypothetical protein
VPPFALSLLSRCPLNAQLGYMGLSPRQQQAAQLIGSGQLQREAAAEVGVHPGTVKRWMRREDFRSTVDRARAALLAENPGPQATLEAALNASKRDGSPDWQSRITAARALLGREPKGSSPEEKVRETTIHFDRIRESDQ